MRNNFAPLDPRLNRFATVVRGCAAHLLKRTPYPLPRLLLSSRIPHYRQTQALDVSWLEKVEPSDFMLEGYRHHEALTAPMAV